MASHQEVAERWVDQILSGGWKFLKNHNMFVSGGRLFSYGSHFELGRLLPNGGFLLNGDRYSVTTAKHQQETEGAVIKSGRPYALIPYSALAAAVIDRDSVKVLEALPPGNETIPVRLEPTRAIEDAAKGEPQQVGANPNSSVSVKYTWPESEIYGVQYVRSFNYTTNEFEDRPDAEINMYHGPSGSVVYEEDGHWYRDTHRHWLGSSLISATVNGRRRKFLSSFDENERRPLYFFCELPKTGATTIAAAIESLKPREVVEAEARGLEVLRQGDVFAIPIGEEETLLWAKPKYGKPSMIVLSTNHTVTKGYEASGLTFGRGILRHAPSGWRRPEHARTKLGDGKSLYRLVRNRVPLAKSTGFSSGSALQSGQARAWTMGGNVD